MGDPTKPVVWIGKDSLYHCRMVDRFGREWGWGVGETRVEAIQAARLEQPRRKKLKKVSGWAERHPVLSKILGPYTSGRKLIRHILIGTMIDAAVGAVLTPIASWAVKKVAKGVKLLIGS